MQSDFVPVLFQQAISDLIADDIAYIVPNDSTTHSRDNQPLRGEVVCMGGIEGSENKQALGRQGDACAFQQDNAA